MAHGGISLSPAPGSALSQGRDLSPLRLKGLQLVLLTVAAATFVVFYSEIFSKASKHPSPGVGPELGTEAARRLLAVLQTAGEGGQGGGLAVAGASLGLTEVHVKQLEKQLRELARKVERLSEGGREALGLEGRPSEASAGLSGASSACLRCEEELAQCRDKDEEKEGQQVPGKEEGGAPELDRDRYVQRLRREKKKLERVNRKLEARVKELEAGAGAFGAGGATQGEPGGEMERLRMENQALRAEVEELKKTSSAGQGDAAATAQAQGVEGELKRQLSELQERYDSLAATKSSEVAAALPAMSPEEQERVKEAARKAVEECGKSQGSPASHEGARLYKCEATEEELQQYMAYEPRKQCPDDWYFVQKLVFLKSCFSLPPRRCFSLSPQSYKEPSVPFPQSLFDPATLDNSHVRWNKQYWPNYEAINNRTWGDCRDCFNLTLEEYRWQFEFQGSKPMDYVLSLKPKGSLKIGLDAGGGTGSFAAKMAQHGITIVTTAMNTETLGDLKAIEDEGLPYMETIAQRGLIPLHVPHKARQPFFDGTLDIIHNINSIKYFSIPEFEELMFEWDRILRPGGVLWFELFYAPVEEMPLYIAVLDLFNYKKLYWNMTPKTDVGEKEGAHVYLNCVLEKPLREDPGAAVTHPRAASS